ncbi:MAG: hypothetical protein Q4C73_04500 [Eubacteriales bacterium]|nr:hypothetical protein [Eubacteriales bacterium]
MAQTTEQCLEFLDKAREAVSELSVAEERQRQMELDEQQLGKSLETETRQMSDAVQTTIKKRRQEIDASYDAEIDKIQDSLKKARGRREKAKNQGMKERIAEETSELCAYNQELRDRMKASFRQGRVPGFCRSKLYYSLYFPRWAKEYFTLLVFAAVLFVALPWGIYFLLPQQKVLYLAALYLAVIIIPGGIYVMIGNHTKLQHMEVLREGRQILDQIHANDKKIRVITSTIRKDRNESLYDLEKFDDEIARMQQELSDVAARKKDALNTFETVTKNILQDEIEHRYREKLETLGKEHEELKTQLAETAAEVKEKRLEVAGRYGSHLGREFLDPFKISDLAGIIRQGQAENVSEAIEVYRGKKS